MALRLMQVQSAWAASGEPPAYRPFCSGIEQLHAMLGRSLKRFASLRKRAALPFTSSGQKVSVTVLRSTSARRLASDVRIDGP